MSEQTFEVRLIEGRQLLISEAVSLSALYHLNGQCSSRENQTNDNLFVFRIKPIERCLLHHLGFRLLDS